MENKSRSLETIQALKSFTKMHGSGSKLQLSQNFKKYYKYHQIQRGFNLQVYHEKILHLFKKFCSLKVFFTKFRKNP